MVSTPPRESALTPDAVEAARAAEAAASTAAAAALALAAAAATVATAAAAAAAASATAVGCWPIREFATLSLGYAACEAEAVAFPFVVRACADFGACASETNVRASLRLERDVKGYRDDDGYTDHVHSSGREALAAWDAANVAGGEPLRSNVIDSEATRGGSSLMPPALRAVPGADDVNPRLRLAYVLSPLPATAGAFGALHCDPPMGSGWQYLAVGQKRWHCIDDGAAKAFSRAACRTHRTPPDMATIALTARVLTADIGAGDFLSFPVNWPHAVATLEASLGLSGYMSVPTPRAAPADLC